MSFGVHTSQQFRHAAAQQIRTCAAVKHCCCEESSVSYSSRSGIRLRMRRGKAVKVVQATRGEDVGMGSKAAAWLDSYPKVSAWMAQYDLRQLLQQHGGLVRLPNFLPPHVAAGLLALLQSYSPADWTMTAAAEDYSANNISHQFWSTKAGRGMAAVTRALALLQPGRLHSFSAAKYCEGHHIAPHDDRAYSQVLMDDGQVITCSRDIAVIYYLTKDWKKEYGGHLVDVEGKTTLVPLYNSLVAFTVPRYHEVTAMATNKPRYSIFGWFLEPGVKYELYTGEDQDKQDGQQQQQQQQQSDAEGHEAAAAGGEDTRAPHWPARRVQRALLQGRRGKRTVLLAAQAGSVFGHVGSAKLTRRRLLMRAKAADESVIQGPASEGPDSSQQAEGP